MVTTKELNNIKKALVDYISTRELDDGDELCLESQEMILKWIEVYFDDVVFEMESTAKRDTTLVGIPPNELASLRAEVARLTDHRKRLCKIIRDTYAELYNAPEINMSNFNDDNVAALNDAMIGAFQNLDAAMCSFSSETGEII